MIKRFILYILANAAALYITYLLLGGDFLITGGIKGYAIAALLFGILNSLVKPILKILTLPVVFLTAGLFTLVINVFILWFAKYSLEVLDFAGVRIMIERAWITYLFASIVLSIANVIIHWLLKK